jgi:hypothetical protein
VSVLHRKSRKASEQNCFGASPVLLFLPPLKHVSMAKQKKTATPPEPTEQEIKAFLEQKKFDHAVSVALFLDYAETIAKLEGIEPEAVKQRVKARVDQILSKKE